MMKTVLIVDDDQEIQALLAKLINDYTDFTPIAAEDGEVALDLISENRPDLVILDVLMPRIGGIALYQDIKKNDATKDIPIIFISGEMKDVVFQREGVEMGAVAYITKPFEMKKMLDLINSTIG